MRFPIATQFAVLVLIPGCLMGYLATHIMLGLRRESVITEGMAIRAGLMAATSQCIDALEEERAAASTAGAAVDRTTACRERSDRQVENWKAVAANAAFAASPAPAEVAKRLQAARCAETARRMESYSAVIDLLIDQQLAIPNAQTTGGLGKVMSAACTLEEAKDHASRLGTELTAIASADAACSDADYERLVSDFSMAGALLESAAHLPVSAASAKDLETVHDGPSWSFLDQSFDAVAKLRSAGHYGLDPVQVARHTSDLLTTMRAVILREADAMAAAARGLAATKHAEMLRTGLLVGLCLVAALAISWWIARGLVRGLALVRQRLAEVALGRIAASALPPGSLDRLARRHDEVGDLSRDLVAAGSYLATMRTAAAAIAAGDLTVQVKARDGQDEFGTTFAQMVGSLQHTIDGIAQAAQALSAAATEMAATSQQLAGNARTTQESATGAASAANQGVAQVQSIAAGSEELSSSVEEVSKQTSQVAELVKTVGDEVARAITTSGRSLERMAALEDMGKRIGEILKLISSIAEQTNLLALNATIEAARAGEAGRGFAVVAGEVKALAHQTAAATTRIDEQVRSIQGEIAQAVGRGKEVTEAIRAIGAHSVRMGESSGSVAAAIHEQSSTTAEMARGLAETSTGLGTIVEGLARMTGQTGEVAQGAQHIEDAAKELDRLVQILRTSVSGFRVDNAIDRAMAAHRAWRDRLLESLQTGAAIDRDRAANQHACDLGKWIEGIGTHTHGRLPAFQRLVEEHAGFHAGIRQVIDLAVAGRRAEAEMMIRQGDFHRRTETVLALLGELKTSAAGGG